MTGAADRDDHGRFVAGGLAARTAGSMGGKLTTGKFKKGSKLAREAGKKGGKALRENNKALKQ
jgi:general stress protein YciG